MQEKHFCTSYIFHPRGLEDNITLFLKRKLDCAILLSPIDRYHPSLSPAMSFLAAGKRKKVILLFFKIAIYSPLINAKNKLHLWKGIVESMGERKSITHGHRCHCQTWKSHIFLTSCKGCLWTPSPAAENLAFSAGLHRKAFRGSHEFLL